MTEEYNKEWCDERHENIRKEFTDVWAKFKTVEGRLWTIILLLVLNLGVVIASKVF